MESVSQVTTPAVAPARRAAWRAIIPALLEAGVVFGICAALLAAVQYGTAGLVDNDAYYHTRMGQLIREQGLTPPFVWLPYTILAPASFYDHHMLFHVYLALFTGDGRPETMIAGAKLASVIMPALATLAVWSLLRSQGVAWPALWAIGLLALSEAFVFRMSMVRAQAASVLVLALALQLLLERRYALLLPLGFFYVWLYNAFPLLLVAAGTYIIATLLAERRLAWRALLYPALGIALGLVINPYFPENVLFTVQHLGPKIGAPTIGVGSEWYPYNTWTLVENSGFALAIWLLGVLGLGLRGRPIDRATLTALGLSIVFGLMLFKSRRFIEYFPPFALVFAALSLAPLVGPWLARRLAWQRRLVLVAAAGALALPMGLTLAKARESFSGTTLHQTFAGASGWLAANAEPGSIVFQTDWDDFPMLFFFNPSNRYIVGLDPTYMELHDRQLWDEWVAITRGQVEQPGAAIRSRFGATHVVSDLEHEDFIRAAQRDPLLVEVYRDQHAVVFAVGK
jgi:hypothetical protein